MNRKLVIAIAIFIVAMIILGGSLYIYLLSPTSISDESIINFEVKEGNSTKKIIADLKEADLIKNEKITLFYIKLNKELTLKAGTYELSKSMNTKDILRALHEGDSIENKGMNVTFVEGKRITYYVDVISKKFGYPEKEILDVLNDQEYLKELIDKYWFVTDEILNKDIYYPLEGYLYPNTYTFYQDASIKEIINKLIDTLAIKLEKYKTEIKNSEYTFHEILSLASDVEVEGSKESDRKLIAGVFLNRLTKNMSLGSDVTTYYAVKKDLKEALWQVDINTVNPYNTRGSNMNGKINIGPICSPSLMSIVAVLKPTSSDYLYFYADYKGDGTVYYSKTYYEHTATVNKFE